MPKSKGRKKKGTRPRPSSSLSEHRRRAGKLVPPLASIPNLTSVEWLSEVFPDMIWLCFLIVEDDFDGMRAANAALKLIDQAIRETGDGELLDRVVDGRLTQLERVPEGARARAIELLVEKSGFERAIPEDFAHALGMYPDAPGSWLIQPWLDQGMTVDWERAQRYLGRTIEEAGHGQSRPATRAKFVALARWAAAGRLQVPPGSGFELFPRYPNDLTGDEIQMVETTARATFGALLAAGEHQTASEDGIARAEWARRFWRSNWNLYPCRPFEEPMGSGEEGSIQEVAIALRREADELHERFVSAASRADPDIYDPDRYEVLTGLVAAAVRSVAAATTSPASWSGEHGLMVVRSIVEALITVRWLLHENEPKLYRQFKEYGRGHLKLLKLHVEEFIDKQDEPPEDLVRFATYLEAEVNADIGEEWQEIQLGGTFAGVSTHEMAKVVGMESEYNFVFAPASASAHREWVTLDRYVLNRCLNPLHRWHRIPRASLGTTIGPEVIESALGLTEDLVDLYTSALGSAGTGKAPPIGDADETADQLRDE